jgi:prepilin-type N-terminal cleavage/methylation domain-containing protein
VARRSTRVRAAGFTIMELMIVVAIIGLMLAASTLALQNVMRTELRSAASRTANAMRFCFDRATMTGKHIRLVFDLEKGEIWIEASEDRVSLRSGSEQHVTSDKEQREEGEEGAQSRRQRKKKQPPIPFFSPPVAEGEGEENSDAEGEYEDEGFEPGISHDDMIRDFDRDMQPVSRARAKFSPLKGMLTKKIKLKKNIAIDSVMTPRMTDPVVKGRTHVYFFPQGHAEPAIIHLMRKDNEDYYSIVLHPLTGQARVYPCFYEVPEDFGASDDVRRKSRKNHCAEQGGI